MEFAGILEGDSAYAKAMVDLTNAARGIRILTGTGPGRVLLLAAVCTFGYIYWLFSPFHDPEIEGAISLLFLNVSNVLFVALAYRVIRRADVDARVRRSWMIFLAGACALIAADVFFILWNRPVVSFADVLYIAYYLLTLVAILTLPFIPLARRERTMLALDLGIVLTACMMLLWYFLVEPVAVWIRTNLPALVNLAYPMLDVLLMAGAVALVQRDVTGVPRKTLLFIATGNILLVGADITYSYYAASETLFLLKAYNSFLLFARFFLLLAVVAQILALEHPQPEQPVLESKARGMLRLTLPYLATAIGLCLFVFAVEKIVPLGLRLGGVFLAMLSLIGFVLLRLHLVLRENVGLYERAESARAEAERQREVAEKAMSAAEEASLAKSHFLSNMSHELRTPLNAIIGYSEILHEEAADEGRKNMLPDLQKIQSASKHLLSLINDILDLSKIEAGRMELYLESFDLATVIREVASTVHPLVQKNANSLEVRMPPDLGRIRADETKVRQILYNLVSNACKFTSNGTILLDVGADNANGAEWIVWKVKDTGIGMTPEQLARLFQAFMQADSSTSRKYGGTGLGLAISQRFCQMMGGSIDVASQPGAGTTFTVRIPRTVETPAESSAETAAIS